MGNDEIIKLYNQGFSIRSIQKQTNHCRAYISKILKENNILIRNNQRTAIKNNIDENYFKKINSKTKAYWLGFIAADGFITSDKSRTQSFGITLSKKDKEHIENFNQCIKSTYKIHDYKAGKTCYNQNSVFSRLLIVNQKMVDNLKKLGIVENKTLVLKFPTEEQVSDKYIYDYIRGYMDGDGSIYFSKNTTYINFTGQKDFLLKIQEKLGICLALYTKDNITYEFSIGGNTQAMKILDKLYYRTNKYNRLYRKYEKYLEIKKILRK